jgi:hypothetical protein
MSILLEYYEYNPYDNPPPNDYYKVHALLGTENIWSKEAYNVYLAWLETEESDKQEVNYHDDDLLDNLPF